MTEREKDLFQVITLSKYVLKIISSCSKSSGRQYKPAGVCDQDRCFINFDYVTGTVGYSGGVLLDG